MTTKNRTSAALDSDALDTKAMLFSPAGLRGLDAVAEQMSSSGNIAADVHSAVTTLLSRMVGRQLANEIAKSLTADEVEKLAAGMPSLGSASTLNAALLAAQEALSSVQEVLSAEAGKGLPVEDLKREGMWNVVVLKDRATRWSYSQINPDGGSFGTGSFPSAKAAAMAGLAGVPAGEPVFVIEGFWDRSQEDYIASHTYEAQGGAAKMAASTVKADAADDVTDHVRMVAAECSGRLNDLADKIASMAFKAAKDPAMKQRLTALKEQVLKADEAVIHIGEGLLRL